MSWISKAENLLNNLDKKAGSVLQQTQEKLKEEESTSSFIPRSPSISKNLAKNAMVLRDSVPKKPSSLKLDQQQWDSMSERSVSSVKTQIELTDNDQYLEMKEAPSVESFSAEKELASAKILLSEMRSENNELKMEVEQLHEQLKSNSSALEIRELQEVNTMLIDEKRDLMLMNQSLESSTANYVKTISELETNLMKLQQSESELKQKLESAKTETKDVRQELTNYKLRAQNQLQMKEKLIEQLKSGDAETETEGGVDMSALQMEIDQIRSERDALQTELNFVSKRFEDSRSFIEKLEHKHRIMEASAEDKISSLNDTIAQLNNASLQFEDEIRLQKQEIQQVREEMLSQKKVMTTKLHEKENELKRLKNTYRESQVNSEIENRVQSLTNSLITKQNNLETITAERNALKLQLEKLSIQHEEVILQLRNQRPQAQVINVTDDYKSSLSNLMAINPFDSRMSRRVKRAYSNLDQFGIRFGVFLRRYPLARILAVFYVFSLHLFVFLVLLQSTPSS